jgi:O-antigen/teichoic acid export membrane protein
MSDLGDPAAPLPTGPVLSQLLARRSNARGVLFSLLGAGAPAVLALLFIPRIAGALGTERFGILALAWTVIGYASFLHLGLGRAVARDTAARDAPGEGSLAETVWTAALMTLALGALAGVLLFAFAPGLVALMNVAPALAAESALAVRVLACALPFTVSTPVLSAVLEARRRFDLANAVVVPSAVATYLGPVLVLTLTGGGLVPLVAVLAASRIAAWGGYLALCLREAPELRARPAFRRHAALPLLSFGGWTTVSAAVSPLLVYLDRFVVGALVSAAAVAYYSTAQEAVLRMGVVSGAVVGVLFPAFARVPEGDGARLAGLLESGVDAVLLLVLPLTLLIAAFAGDLLHLWMGPAYGAAGAPVLAWLAVGLLVNGLAKMPSSMIQAVGRPDLTARLHLVELPLFVGVLAALVWRWGVVGAAVAWLARATADAAALFWIACRRVPEARGVAWRAAWVMVAGAFGVAVMQLLPTPLERGIAIVVAAVALAWAAYGVVGRRARQVATVSALAGPT